ETDLRPHARHLLKIRLDCPAVCQTIRNQVGHTASGETACEDDGRDGPANAHVAPNKVNDAAAQPRRLQNESSQLIKRVNNLQADENERCDHQIETKMHEDLEPNFSAARAVLRRTGNQTRYSLVTTCL